MIWLLLSSAIFGAILGIWHLFLWLITKGTIWVAAELFNVFWYDRFWAVYLLVFLISMVFTRRN